MAHRICRTCSATFIDTSTTRPRSLCDGCRKRPAGGVQVWQCAFCGVSCSRKRVRGQRPKWCSQRCADLGKSGRSRTCARCGAEYFGLGKKYCSVRCVTRMPTPTELVHVGPKAATAPSVPVTIVTGPRWWAVIIQGPCGWCGEQMTATGSTSRFCSKKCSRNARYARRGSKFTISPKVRLEIYERDGWLCQLCGDLVAADADPSSDWYPSLDHIEPQSHALIPDHSPSNLRTAHRWCNAVRGDGRWHADLFQEVSLASV